MLGTFSHVICLLRIVYTTTDYMHFIYANRKAA